MALPPQAACARILLALLLPLMLASPTPAASSDPYEEINSSWDRFGSVYGRILQDYYAVVPPDSIMRGAIEGMLHRLDAYSQYFDEDGLRQLRQDTTGKFAGLGITVAQMDGYPVVVAPMEATPAADAGLMMGDLIVSIEGRATQGMTLDEVVDLLRGEPGTQVTISVRHSGPESHTRDLAITRRIIKIDSVTLVDEVAPGVGYIGMRRSRFSESTSSELADALVQLTEDGAQAIVLDLRGNPGGLLSQATQVADLFLPRGAPIVSIRERDGRRDELRRSQQRPPSPDIPLAVLIDGGSASASEIVAGAIQDNDRGVIVGTTSFGKGSVQTIFDLHQQESSALKLTTARYYTPSGRSIHRNTLEHPASGPSTLRVGDQNIPITGLLQIIGGAKGSQEAKDALRARFDLTETAADRILETTLGEVVADSRLAESQRLSDDDEQTPADFRTRAGRVVYGGGGITPDIAVPPPQGSDYARELQRRGLFFEFAAKRVAADSAFVSGLESAALDQHIISEFEDFLAEKVDVPQVDDEVRRELQALQETLGAVGLQGSLTPTLSRLATEIDAAVTLGHPQALQDELLKRLRPLVALRLHGRRAQLRAQLADDLQLERAVELLLDQATYAQALQQDRL
jgi:carboxyl-terminal processing protease